ncbi:MAG: YigZ family protein [Bacteroidales bacterium]|nr:YigZ family protein [Bacteroidales bacterium]
MRMNNDQYTSIAAPTEGLFKDKGSRFIAFALPVSGEEEVKEAVDNARKKYHDARHVCYAYRLGANGGRENGGSGTGGPGPDALGGDRLGADGIGGAGLAAGIGGAGLAAGIGGAGLLAGKWRMNDDGEPSGSAGRPILGQIDSYGLSDILIIVVRYFGGIKLGIPGLINAYRSAAADALSKAQIIEKTVCLTLTATFPYEKMGEVMKLTKSTRGTGGGSSAGGEGIRVLNLEMDTLCRITLSVPLSQAPAIRQCPCLTFEESGNLLKRLI